ncbi:MAG: hypothetical protein AOA65_2295 [Candidatus Bathyarchaeota archaeon BA1]|nr:MAG: hypothetical protein AOA65_2295 [Candidatus Bathyarchaeota archaeon BA1]
MFTFMPLYKDLREVLMDHKLAALGDAYVNCIYSLARSKRRGEPTGAKVDSRVLAEALRRAGLRSFLPSRVDRHKQADAAEALIVYAWAQGVMTMEEGVSVLGQCEDATEAFCSFLRIAKTKLNL